MRLSQTRPRHARVTLAALIVVLSLPLARALPLARTPAARLVIAIPAVCAEPLGLAVAKQADLVVLCVERARTRLSDVRRSADLIGRERMAGCFLVR